MVVAVVAGGAVEPLAASDVSVTATVVGVAGGTYPQPDNCVAALMVIVLITIAPTFTRSCAFAAKSFDEHTMAAPIESVLALPTLVYTHFFFTRTPVSTMADFLAYFFPSAREMNWPLFTDDPRAITGEAASATRAGKKSATSAMATMETGLFMDTHSTAV
jgi:hypothetical protein